MNFFRPCCELTRHWIEMVLDFNVTLANDTVVLWDCALYTLYLVVRLIHSQGVDLFR